MTKEERFNMLLNKEKLIKTDAINLKDLFEYLYPNAFKYDSCFCSANERNNYRKKIIKYIENNG